MNLLTQEWISKAEGDFASSGRELRARKDPNYDSACFHAQQCAEKYLKAAYAACKEVRQPPYPVAKVLVAGLEG
jgi:HEPN domain-containing protein